MMKHQSLLPLASNALQAVLTNLAAPPSFVLTAYMDSLPSHKIIFSKEFITLSPSVAKFSNRCNLQRKFAMSVISLLCISDRPSQLSMAFGKGFSLKHLS